MLGCSRSQKTTSYQSIEIKDQITNMSITEMKPLPPFKNYDRLLKEKKTKETSIPLKYLGYRSSNLLQVVLLPEQTDCHRKPRP
jgi:hypothetical protein